MIIPSKFSKLCKYSPSLVSNRRDGMSRSLTGVYKDLVEEFHLDNLHYNITISRIMVHAQQVEETRLMRKIRDAK